MFKKKYIVIAVGIVCISLGSLFVNNVILAQSSGVYDPWLDLNDDGIIDAIDLQLLAWIYGTSGTPINKTELLLDLQARLDSLNASLLTDYYNITECDLIFVDASGDTIVGYLDVDSGTLYVDDVNDRVGIGTSSPSGNLEIESSSVWPSIYLDNQKTGDMTTFIRFQEGGANQWGIGTDVAADGSDNFWIYDYTSFGTRLLIDTDGNVGIGTTSPTEKLEVNGHAIATPIAGRWQCDSTDSGAGYWEWDSQLMNTEPSILEWTAGANNIRIAKAGYYMVCASVLKSALSSGEATRVFIYKSGSYIANSYAIASGTYHHHSLCVIDYFNVGEVVRVFNVDSDSDRYGSTHPYSILSIYRLN